MAPWQIAVLCVVPVVGLVALVLWARRGMAEARRRLTAIAGKTQGVKLLAVEWRDGDGSDQIAWRVPELDPWLDALAGAGVSVRRPAEARDP